MRSPKSMRFSGGGGSSRNFPWSPKADVILWVGGGGSSTNFQKGGGPGLQKAGSSTTFALIRNFYIFRLSRRGGPGPPGPPPESATA